MGLFEGISDVPGVSDDALCSLGGAVIAKLHTLPFPRSLCELRSGEEDYRRLCDWFGKLQPWQLGRWLTGINSRRVALELEGEAFSYAEVTGCLLLLLASETARREAREGYVWAAVRRPFPHSVERALFAHGQPREAFKDAMEASARKLNLRHVYGQEGTQEYYLSVYLQFGFTRRGMARLANWLVGQPTTEAIQYLSGARGAAVRSESFTQLWDTLRNYRTNNITEARARQTLAENPWVLPDWADELLLRAKEHADESRPANIAIADDEPASPYFLAEPRLRWDLSADPKFVSTIVNLADFEFEADRYHVRSGANAPALAQLLQNQDGSYRSTSEEIVFPGDIPEFMVTLVDDNGNSPASQPLTLWDPMEDVELFNLRSGRKVDPWLSPIRDGSEYALLVSSDLTVEPAGLPFHRLRDDKTLYLLRLLGDNPARVSLEGVELWSHGANQPDSNRRGEPEWAHTVSVEVTPPDQVNVASTSGRRLYISGFRNDVTLLYTRLGSQPLDFSPIEGGGYVTGEFNIDPLLFSKSTLSEFQVRLGLRTGGEKVNITRSTFINVTGVLRLSDGGWRTVDPRDQLSAIDAGQFVYRIVTPARMNGFPVERQDDLALMEGAVFLSRLRKAPRPLGDLGGYGAPLGVRHPYNWTEPQNLLTIAAETYDPGIITDAQDAGDGKVNLYLRQPLEPGTGHQMIFWRPGARPDVLSAQETVDYVSDVRDEWEVSHSHQFLDDVFVAVAYEGAKIGAWWPQWPVRCLADVAEPAARETAAMLKWLHAPIVSQSWIGEVQDFAQRCPSHVLSAWLLDADDGLPDALRLGHVTDHWGAAVRQIFAGWNPSAQSAYDIVSALGLGIDSSHDRICEALQTLSRLTPLLMGRVLQALEISGQQKHAVIQRMRVIIGELPETSSPSDIRQREEELLVQVAETMHVDRTFVERGIVERALDGLDYEDLGPVDANNIQVALGIRPFRTYLGLRVLSTLT